MGSNILEERMLEDTLLLFQGGKATDLSAAQGVNLIDGWLLALQGDPNIGQIEAQLSQLREALQDSQPDEATIKSVLLRLADETQATAEGPNAEGTWTGKLESLSKILRHFGSSL
jgi:hypothetical protein